MIGSAGKKLSTMVELAEDLYERVNELRNRMESMSETVDETADRVETLEAELAEQRALVEAIAEERGIDVEAVSESATAGNEGADAPDPSEVGAAGTSDGTAE